MISRIKNSILNWPGSPSQPFLIRLFITLPLHVYLPSSSRSFVGIQRYLRNNSYRISWERTEGHKQGKADRSFVCYIK